MKWKNFWRKAWAFALALCLSLSLCPQLIGTAYAVGEAAMDKLLNWGVVGGYPDGGLHPERSLTRAEFVAMVNRAYGYTQTGATPFIDVPNTAWFYDDIGIAYNANYFGGVSPRMAAPDSPLTREQAMVLLARNMRLDPVAGEVTEFADGRNFADWSRGYARAAAQMGLIGGYGDGSYKPQNNISRGEMGIMLERALGTLVNKPGTHTLSDTYGNVTISSTGTTLKDTTIAGNLYITGGLDLGDITLDNVRVLGDIIVAGGGESQSGESIILRNVEADSLLVDSIADQYVSLRAEGNTEISDTLLRSDAFVQDRTRPGQGLQNISLESPDMPANFTLSGNLENVVNKTPASMLNIAMGTVDNLTIDEKARDSTLNLDVNSMASTLNLDTATNVAGIGDIDKLYVNAAGSTVEMLPDDITIRPGLNADIAGTTMNATQAREASTDPRLLAGYPKLRNIAPTNATGVYSANKAGTVYWAVSATVDGSVSEEELITPTEGNAQIVQNGNLPLTASETEVTAAIASLIPDGNYYLSAVMADARGRKSPVKVVSFVTPDNTTPAFNSGYPAVSQNEWEYVRNENGSIQLDSAKKPVRNFHVQVSAMSSKSCTLYYALYDRGSTAPTAQQFRIGALGAPIQSGTLDAVKNYINYIDFDGLDELKTYDAYLCLIDADGSRSSAVQKLTFTTVDGTPPEFLHETPETVGKPLATSIPTRVNLNENSTVFWAAVRHGIDKNSYIAAALPSGTTFDSASSILEWLSDLTNENADTKGLESLKRKIESGAGSVSSGSATARENADLALSITGLTAETPYDIFYVAKDAAGNYSDVKLIENSSTLDVNPPTVTQSFTHINEGGNPYTDTDISLIFSEDVQLISNPTDESLAELINGKTLSQLASGKELGTFLKESVRFYNESSNNPNQPVSVKFDPNSAEEWGIDYTQATLSESDDGIVVTIPNAGIKLNSDSIYHFELVNLQDLAAIPNRIPDAASKLPSFHTVAALVTLRPLNVSSTTIPDDTPDDTSDDETVLIDMAFSLTPLSTNVEKDVDWDLVFWSDSSVSFEVYELNSDDIADNKGTPVRKVANGTAYGNPSNVEIVNDNAVTASNVTADDYQGYIGCSLFRDFYGLSFFPGVTGEGNVISRTNDALKASGTLPENTTTNSTTKYYGIHFTSVKHVSEGTGGAARGTWDATVNFRISVLTGSSNSLGNLASDITKATLAESEEHLGISQIHSPRPFSLRKVFTNSAAPDFYANYPQFEDVTDTTATLRLMLDRAGTVYYAVAPIAGNDTSGYVPSITTKLDDKDNGIFSTAELDRVPITRQKGIEVAEPLPYMIYNPNFGSDSIYSGSRTLGTSYVEIYLENLTPSTTYFAYFVMQGVGQVYSQKVLVNQFTTEAVNRPKLYIVNNGASTVNVRSRNMNAVADYAVFQMSSLPTALSQSFGDAIDTTKYTYTAPTSSTEGSISDKAATPNKLASIPATSGTYTVYQAMSNQDTIGGSMYDKYASATHKDTIRQLVTAQTFTGGRIDGSSGVLLTQNETDSLNCATAYNIRSGQQYLFIASARSRSADEAVNADSYGFSAYQPVYIIDDAPPVISAVSGNITVDRTVSPMAMTGTIYLTFDKDIYYYESDTEKRLFANTGDGSTTKGISNFQYLNGTAPMDSGTMMPTSITGSRTVAINVGGWKTGTPETTVTARQDDNFRATPNLVSYYSSPNYADPLEFTLHYDASANRAYVVFNSAAWYSNGSAPLTTRVTSPAVTSISLSPSTLSLDVGQQYDVRVLFSPSNATGDIVWTYGGDTGAIRVEPNGASVTITALRVTSAGAPARVRATLEGDNSKTAVIDITVTSTPTVNIIHEGRTVTNSDIAVNSMDSVDLDIEIKNIPAGLTQEDYTVLWYSSNSDFRISTEGVVSAISSSGNSTTITADVTNHSTQENYRVRCTIRIR